MASTSASFVCGGRFFLLATALVLTLTCILVAGQNTTTIITTTELLDSDLSCNVTEDCVTKSIASFYESVACVDAKCVRSLNILYLAVGGGVILILLIVGVLCIISFFCKEAKDKTVRSGLGDAVANEN